MEVRERREGKHTAEEADGHTHCFISGFRQMEEEERDVSHHGGRLWMGGHQREMPWAMSSEREEET